MYASLIALELLLIALAGRVNDHHLGVIEYLMEENRVLREQLGKRRLRFTDDQRRRLALKAKLLGRALLSQVAMIVTPDSAARRDEVGSLCQAWPGSTSDRRDLPASRRDVGP
jgi:hypothetical protein